LIQCKDVESVLQHTDAPIGNYFIYIKTNSATNQVKLKVGDKRTSVLEVNSTGKKKSSKRRDCIGY
jgi:uncharacterized protein YfaS (alpha-2-macroglobulin family)